MYRLYDENGMAKADVLALTDQTVEPGKEYRYYHPMVDYRQFTFKAASVKEMLKLRLKNGKRTEPRLDDKTQLAKSRETLRAQLETLDASYKRIINPHIYKVSLTEELKNLKVEFIKKNIK